MSEPSRLPTLFRVASLGVALSLVACSASEAPRRGQLMVELATDLSVPKDISQLRVVVKTDGDVGYQYDLHLEPPSDKHLPGTLAVVAGSTPNAQVSIEVTGIRRLNTGKLEPRIFSKVVTTIEPERLRLLRVPVQWLCDGNVVDDGTGDYKSACKPIDGREAACVAGTCRPVAVDSSSLPDFDPKDVYGGGSDADDPLGRCFDALSCLGQGEDVAPADLSRDCSFTLDDDGKPINVGLRLPSGDGICDGTRADAACYVPLDRDDTSGWSLDSRAPAGKLLVRLPLAACEAIDAGRASAVRVTRSCETKTPVYPTCGT